MKNFLFALVTLIIIQLLTPQCANPKAPRGGPKDTIPPILLNTIPPYGQLNFQGNEITLIFNERITAQKLASNLIITPNLNLKYKTIVKKNSITLKFEEDFPDSTTITLNFFDGITDVTEKNPVNNLTYVFSKGNYLDSLEVNGDIYQLMTSMPSENYLVGLYPYSDTLNILSTKPTYFTTTDKDGKFSIKNIKDGKYKLLSFEDQNRNLQLEPASESHGFLSGFLNLDTVISNLKVPVQEINSSELKLISSKTFGKYFTLRYTKGLDSIFVSTEINYNFDLKTNSIIFYKPDNYNFGDSIFSTVRVIDSIGSQSVDTVYVKFNEVSQKSSPFIHTLTPKIEINPYQEFTFSFTKPLKKINTELIEFRKDSLFTLKIDTIQKLNRNKTSFSWIQKIDTVKYFDKIKQIQDSVNKTLKKRDSIAIYADTLLKDKQINENTLNTKANSRRITLNKNIQLYAKKGAFISIENDTIPDVLEIFNFNQNKDGGILNLSLTTIEKSYFIEIINPKYKTVYKYTADSKHSFTIKPGNYGIRILVDTNNDGIWSPGNLLKDIPPERVFVYSEFTNLRSNWDVNIDISF